MKTAEQAIGQITLEAKEKNVQEIRFVQSAKVGDICRQGDIYVFIVPKDHPKGAVRKDRQLAPGFSKGSRHMAEEGIELFEGAEAPASWKEKMHKAFPKLSISVLERELMGPRIKVKKRALITHPEHAHVSLPSGSDCQIIYQLNPRTMKRAED